MCLNDIFIIYTYSRYKMFYILASRIPFVYNIDNKKDKLFRTFLIGSVCYIILHGLLNSKKFSSNQFVDKYKKYLLYLVGADLSLALGIIYLIDKKINNDDNSYSEDVSEDSDDNNTIDENNNKMTREEILQNFYRNQNQMNTQQQQQQSPFINRTNAEELKRISSENVTNINDNTNNNANNNTNENNNKELKEVKINKECKSISSNKNNTDDFELTNDDNNSKLSNKNKSIEVISDTDIPIYRPTELQQRN